MGELNTHHPEAHLLSLLPPGWACGRGYKLRPARVYGTEQTYRAWLTPLHEAGQVETVLYHSSPSPRGGVRWFAPGIPIIYLDTLAATSPGDLPHLYRLPVVAALEAADLELIEYLPYL